MSYFGKILDCFGLSKLLPYYTLISPRESFYFFIQVFIQPLQQFWVYIPIVQSSPLRIFHLVYWAFISKCWVFQEVRIPQVLQNHTPPLSLKLLGKSAHCPMPAEEPRILQREHALPPSPLRIREYKKRWESGINPNSVDHGNYIKI